MLILVQHKHLHHLDQPWPCHWLKIVSSNTTAPMMLHWGGSSSLQCYPSIVSHCTWAYHISCLTFVIKSKDVGRFIVVSFMDHNAMCIIFFVLFALHWRNAGTTMSNFVFIICHVVCRCILVNYVPTTPSLWSKWGGGALINNDTASFPSWLKSQMKVFSAVTLSWKTIKRDGRIKNLLSLVYLGSTPISIVYKLPLHELGCLVFISQQCAVFPSCHGSGGSNRGPSLPSLPRMVMASYWSINIHGSTTRQVSVSVSIHVCSFCLYFICFIVLFDDPFLLMIYCLFGILFRSLDHSFLYYLYFTVY